MLGLDSASRLISVVTVILTYLLILDTWVTGRVRVMLVTSSTYR